MRLAYIGCPENVYHCSSLLVNSTTKVTQKAGIQLGIPAFFYASKKSLLDGNNTYLLQLTDAHDNTLFVELSRDGKYWNVNSAGVFSNRYSNRKEKVWSASAQQNDASASVRDDLWKSGDKADTPDNPSGNSSTPSSDQNKKLLVRAAYSSYCLPKTRKRLVAFPAVRATCLLRTKV